MPTDRETVVAFWQQNPGWTPTQIAEYFGGGFNLATLRQWKKRYVSKPSPSTAPSSAQTSAQAPLPLPGVDPDDVHPAAKKELAELGLTPEELSGSDMVDQVGLTLERKARIVKLLRLGVPQGVAARRVGISEVTYYAWLQRGRDPESGIYKDFRDQVGEALATSEAQLIGYLRKAAKAGEWRAAKFLLERRFPARWREQKVIETHGTGPADGGTPGPSIAIQVQAGAGLQLVALSADQLAGLTGRNLDRDAVHRTVTTGDAVQPSATEPSAP